VVMPENAMLMLHEPSAVVAGTAEDLLSMAAALEKMRGSLVAAYRAKTGLAQERIEELMSRETWLSASEALELGFTDRIEQAVEMAACFDLSGFRNAPEALSLPSSINNEESITMNEHTKPPSEQADDAGEKNSVKPAEAASTEPSKSAAQTDEARERSAQIVDLDAVRAADRKATLAYVAEVNELCALAGRGELAADFIARALPAEQVRKALLEARAAAGHTYRSLCGSTFLPVLPISWPPGASGAVPPSAGRWRRALPFSRSSCSPSLASGP